MLLVHGHPDSLCWIWDLNQAHVNPKHSHNGALLL